MIRNLRNDMSGFGGFPDLPGFGKEQLQFVVKARRSFIRTLFVYATVISLVVSLIVLGVSQFITPDYSSQAYTDKDGNWKSTNSMRINDLPKAALVLNKAYEYLVIKQDAPLSGEEVPVNEEEIVM